jgi:hypothetical protein
MLQNAPWIIKIGVDTEENEPPKECCVVAKNDGAHDVQKRAAPADDSRLETFGPFDRPGHITLSEARSRLYQHRFPPSRAHSSVFLDFYEIIYEIIYLIFDKTFAILVEV